MSVDEHIETGRKELRELSILLQLTDGRPIAKSGVLWDNRELLLRLSPYISNNETSKILNLSPTYLSITMNLLRVAHAAA